MLLTNLVFIVDENQNQFYAGVTIDNLFRLIFSLDYKFMKIYENNTKIIQKIFNV